MLAKGGITTGPTLAMIGEGVEQEAVLPLSKLNSLLNRPEPGSSIVTSSSGAITLNFKNEITIQGNADRAIIEQSLMSEYEFKRMIERNLSQKERLSFKN